jgi:hypothetical protein
VCHTFDCLWRESPVLPEEMRPDRCGVMFELYRPERLVIMMTLPGKDWRQAEVMKLISRMLVDGYAVWIVEEKDRHLMLPQGQAREDVMARTEAAWKRKDGSAKLH